MKSSIPGQRATGEDDHRMMQGGDHTLRNTHLPLHPWSLKIHQLFLNDLKLQNFVSQWYCLMVDSENVQQHRTGPIIL